MVGSSHEALHRIFQKDPTLLTRALQRVLHVPFPEPRQIAALNVDLTEIEPVPCLADPQAKQMWRGLMTATQYIWRHPLAEQVREEGREEGRAEAKAEMVLHMLQWRGIEVPDAVHDRVTACTDLDRLEVWAQRAMHAKDAPELFAGE